MLTIHVQKDNVTMTLALQGELLGKDVSALERDWLNAAREHHHGIRIDLRNVEEIDEAGKALLSRMFSSGVEIVVGCHGPHCYAGPVSMTDHSKTPPVTATLMPFN